MYFDTVAHGWARGGKGESQKDRLESSQNDLLIATWRSGCSFKKLSEIVV